MSTEASELDFASPHCSRQSGRLPSVLCHQVHVDTNGTLFIEEIMFRATLHTLVDLQVFDLPLLTCVKLLSAVVPVTLDIRLADGNS